MQAVIDEIQDKISFLDKFVKKNAKWVIDSSVVCKLHIENVKWKNSKAKSGDQYKPTDIEQLANVVSHGIWIFPALLGAIELFQRSKSSKQYLVSWVYGGALTMLFVISTIFHCSCYYRESVMLKNILHRCDRAMIYIFIAGSYFPWFELGNAMQSVVLGTTEWMIWILAGFGIIYQQVYHERFKCLETFLYILIGLGPAVVIIMAGHEFNGMSQLKLGGFLYIVGTGFFKSDGLVPMAHAIWHMFVVVAAGVHYYAILVNLYPKTSIP